MNDELVASRRTKPVVWYDRGACCWVAMDAEGLAVWFDNYLGWDGWPEAIGWATQSADVREAAEIWLGYWD